MHMMRIGGVITLTRHSHQTNTVSVTNTNNLYSLFEMSCSQNFHNLYYFISFIKALLYRYVLCHIQTRQSTMSQFTLHLFYNLSFMWQLYFSMLNKRSPACFNQSIYPEVLSQSHTRTILCMAVLVFHFN